MNYSAKPWNDFFQDHDVLVPYLDACVFISRRLGRLPPGASVYEFGCGMGNNLKFLKGLFPATRLLGSDVSPVAIEKLRSIGLDNSHLWVNGDELRIPEAIDLAIERGALQHVSKPQARVYLDEIYAALKPGGEAFFEIASTEHSLFKSVGDGGADPHVGLRTFYSLDEISALFSRYRINRIWHLKREIVRDANGNLGDAQGSYQVEVQKA